GTLTLAGSSANTYSGATEVSAGTLILNGSSANGTIVGSGLFIGPSVTVREDASDQIADSTPVTINGGTLMLGRNSLTNISDFLASTTLTGGGITVNGASGFVSTGNITVNPSPTTAQIFGRVNQSATFTWNIASGATSGIDLDVPLVVFGSGGIVKTGAGAVRLAGANTFTGGVNLVPGTIVIDNDSALGPADLSVTGNGTLRSDTVHSVPNVSITISSGKTLTIDGASPNLALNAVGIFGGGNLVKNGAGTLTIGGSNDVGGRDSFSTITVNSGTVLLDRAV